MERDEKGEDQIMAVGFAAGMAAFMACIQRAIVVTVFMHWRVWAFLALNLLLLVILFISKFQNNPTEKESSGDSDLKEKRRQDQDQCELQISTDGSGEKCDENNVAEEAMKNQEDEGANKEDCECEDGISNEELNRRVEAFIAMFRRHLACDARGKTTHDIV